MVRFVIFLTIRDTDIEMGRIFYSGLFRYMNLFIGLHTKKRVLMMYVLEPSGSHLCFMQLHIILRPIIKLFDE